jgi:uncharacterized repeat protein (TIGR01451 family)
MKISSLTVHAGALALLGAGALATHPAFAADAAHNCVQLHNDVLMEQKYLDAEGHAAVRTVPPAKVVPGTVMLYTITARNSCAAASDRLAITNPVPEHMQYVGGTAAHDGTETLYSIDATHYGKLETLAAQDTDGSSRPARAEDVRSIRWTFVQGLAAGQSVSVQFRATVQ